jgi:hypothetical protein
MNDKEFRAIVANGFEHLWSARPHAWNDGRMHIECWRPLGKEPFVVQIHNDLVRFFAPISGVPDRPVQST